MADNSQQKTESAKGENPGTGDDHEIAEPDRNGAPRIHAGAVLSGAFPYRLWLPPGMQSHPGPALLWLGRG